MSAPRPLWMGVPRGTPIVSMAALDPAGDAPEDPGFLARLRHRLAHLVGGGTAAVVGFLATAGMLLGVPALAVRVSPEAVVALALLPAGWALVCAAAGLAVFARGEGAPAWARALVAFLAIVGRLATVTFVVLTAVVLLITVVGLIMGMASGRER